jgi:sortase A
MTAGRRRRSHLRAVGRHAGALLIVSGVVLLADAVLTLTWQEPLSAVIATREQQRLEREARGQAAATVADLRRLEGARDAAQRVRKLALHFRRRLQPMGPFGRLRLPTLDRAYLVSHDADVQAALRAGPAHYPDTPLPGEGATVGIAGHRTTYGAPFRTLHRLRRGDPIELEMPYARFRYRVEKVISVLPTEVWVKRPVGRERLILSASHPPYSAARRLVAFARLIEFRLPDVPDHEARRARSPRG